MGATRELLDIGAVNAPDLLPALGFALVWLAVRFVFYFGMRAYWKAQSPGKGIKDVGKQEKVLEESYAILGGLVAFALGAHAFQQSDRGGCGVVSTASCFSDWPADVGPLPRPVTLYYTVELGWYLHYLAKHPLGIGMQDNAQMHAHHASTITLLLLSYTLNLYRIGVLVLFLLNLSNPFLHLAKVLHYVESAGDQWSFMAFSVAFFISRIVAFPAVVLRATLLSSAAAHPAFLDPSAHLALYLTANGLLCGLMVLQIVWFGGIVRLVSKALAGSKDDFNQQSRVTDYARTKQE